MTAETILKSVYPSELVDALLNAYKGIESNFSVKRWKASELDAGHFVEASRRIIDKCLTGAYTPIGSNLSSFTDAELKRLEQASGDESYRQLIPRVLKSIYNIRNKRGVGHLGSISPNEMDATLILYSSKWILSEFVRLAAGNPTDPSVAQHAVDKIMERRLELIWKSGNIVRILDCGLSAREQILILLYDSNSAEEDALRSIIEYKNASAFRKILKRLHADRLIEFSAGAPIAITSKGVTAAEQLIIRLSNGAVQRVNSRRRRHK